ncbi:MAG TPA: hypothetical protein VKX96_02555 [Chloroflexota bacterium]|jgi:hypothetical protein|nr:hypothetical protein [Chloroflexota bacterium]
MTLVLTPFQKFLAGASMALLVFCAIVGYQYSVEQSQKAELNARLASLQSTINKINAAEANGNDPLLRNPAFPADPPNLDLASVILSSAAASGVQASPFQAVSGQPEKIGNDTYRTITVNLIITGSLPQVLNFFDRVEQGGVRSLVFDNMQVQLVNGRWTVQMELIAYAQSS